MSAPDLALPDVAALEARLRREPDDDETWLVYADWLIERGDVRGELLQLAARPRTNATMAAMAAIEAEHGDAWLSDVPNDVMVLESRAGFVLRARVFWSVDGAPPVEALLALPCARLLHTLELRGSATDLAGLSALDLRRLAVLDCAYVPIGAAGAIEIAAARLSELRALDLRYGRIGDRGAAALARAPSLARLTRLHLQRNDLGPEGARALAGATFTELEELDLRYSPIGADGARALSRAAFARSLRRLGLHREDVGPDGARVLATAESASPAIQRLWATA